MVTGVKSKKRVRRTTEEARKLILDAAEDRLAVSGPDGLRLQEIADAAGISHPSILHHFESREGLIGALKRRVADRLEANLREVLDAHADETTSSDPDDALETTMIDRLFEAMRDQGLARLLAWSVLTKAEHEPPVRDPLLLEITDRVHKARQRGWTAAGQQPKPHEETLFLVLLATYAAIGEGIVGDEVRRQIGLGTDPSAIWRFQHWFAHIIARELRA